MPSSLHLESVSAIFSLSDFRSAIGARIFYAQNCISELKRTITRSYIRQVSSEIEVTLAFKGDFDCTKGIYKFIAVNSMYNVRLGFKLKIVEYTQLR